MTQERFILIEGDVEFHFQRQPRLTRANRTIKLRPMEVKTLTFILSHTHQYLTKLDIARGIWGTILPHDEENKSAQAKKYVSMVRKHLGAMGIDDSWLMTEEHQGYKVNCRVEYISNEQRLREAQAAAQARQQAEESQNLRKTRVRIAMATVAGLMVTIALWFGLSWLFSEQSVRINNVVQLTSLSGLSRHPAYSFDGKAIAFVHTRTDGTSKILVKVEDDINYHVMTRGEQDLSPAFSPNGKRLAFQYKNAETCEIRMLNLDNQYQPIGDSIHLTHCHPNNSFAAIEWLSDEVLLFTDRSAQNQPNALYQYHLGHKRRQQLASVGDRGKVDPGFYDIFVNRQNGTVILLDTPDYVKTRVSRLDAKGEVQPLRLFNFILMSIALIDNRMVYRSMDNQLMSIELDNLDKPPRVVYPNPLKPIGYPVSNGAQNRLAFISGEFYKSHLHSWSISDGDSSEIISSRFRLTHPHAVADEVLFISRESGIKQIYSYKKHLRYQLTNFKTDPKISGFVASADKRWLAITSDNGTSIYRRHPKGLTQVKHFPSGAYPDFKDNGERLLLTMLDQQGGQSEVREFQLDTTVRANAFEPTGIIIAKARFAMYHPSGILYVPSSNDQIRRFTLEKDESIIHNIRPANPDSIDASNDFLFVATKDRQLLKIDLRSHQVSTMAKHMYGQLTVNQNTLFYLTHSQGQMDIVVGQVGD